MEQKIILCDLDGTLLRSDKTISELTLDVLRRCREKGMLLGFSTSRGQSNVNSFAEKIKPDILICNGGASLVYRESLIHTCTFTLDETQRILNAAYRECGDDVEITMDTLDAIFWNRTDNKSTNYALDSGYDDFKNVKTPAMKICVQTDDRRKALLIADEVPGCDVLPFSDIPWYKFSACGATKENAIQFLCKYLDVSTDQIIAFGDDHNDVGMLKLCGTGVAMGNAIPEVKNAANIVTCTNDQDGVAKFLLKLL